jgi:hypothetical protein
MSTSDPSDDRPRPAATPTDKTPDAAPEAVPTTAPDEPASTTTPAEPTTTSAEAVVTETTDPASPAATSDAAAGGAPDRTQADAADAAKSRRKARPAADATAPLPASDAPDAPDAGSADPVAATTSAADTGSEPSSLQPEPETRRVGEPTPAAAARAAAARVTTDSGRHATARPAPVAPAPAAPAPIAPARPDPVTAEPGTPTSGAPGPVTAATTAAAAGRRPDTFGGPATAPLPPAPAPPEPASPAVPPPPEPGRPFDTAPAPITPEPRVEDPSLFPAPNAPRSPSAGTHVLGVIVGLILGPVAVAGVLLGQSRILAVQVDRWDASLDVLGIVLVSVGLLLLGCVLLLGVWTAAVPITAGIVLTALGGFYLYAPGVARRQTLGLLTTEGWHTQVTQVTVVGTSGTLLVAGFLVLVGGLVVAGARRHGLHLGAFRERNRA